MKARLIATGERAPGWVAQGFADYQKRLSHWLPLELVEVEPGLRGKGRDPRRAIEEEGRRVQAAIPKGAYVVALDVPGKPLSSEQLAAKMEHWRGQGRDLVFLIGGPEGHAAEVSALADEKWSIGPLTLPHMMVRLIVVEQIY
ncbi:MAG: 23S rRNA (pseudouridine(1915)-N(3))-methyltransferase RlmH, partial [Stenotrophomonas koreensis]